MSKRSLSEFWIIQIFYLHCNGTRPLSRCYHDKMTLESLLNQFKSENSSLGRRTNISISVELVKACAVLDMFKTFKNEVLYYYNTRV